MRKLYLYLTLLFACLTYLAQSQTVTIGTGTSATLGTGQGATSLQSPYNPYYNYSYVQTLYLQSEISASGSITSISYYFNGSSLANSDGVKIYMGVVSRSAFTSTTDWEPLSNLTLVYDGTISGTVPGWVTITLSTPFTYNNTGNLLIAVDENASGNSGSTGYRATNLGSNRVIFYRDDTNNPDPTAPPTAGGRSSLVGNIKIDGLTLQGCQPATGINISSVTPTSATAGWTAPAGGSAVVQYNWELRTSGAAGSGATGLVASGNTASTTVNLSSLASNTAHSFYLRTDCGAGSYSAWSAATAFTTPCNPVTTLPFFENFNNAGLPSCWTTAVVSGTTNWTAGTTTSPGGFGDIPAAYSGTRFTAKAYNTSTANLITPPMSLASLGTNQARFSLYIYRISATVPDDEISVYINATPNTSGATKLLTIKTLTTESPSVPSSGWYKYGADIPASFNTGTVYFIIEGVSAAGSAGYDLGVEDFLVEAIPTCEAPTGVSISNINSSEADISWTPPTTGGSPIDYQIYYSTNNTAPTSGTVPIIASATAPTTISPLSPNTTYYVWVRTNCGPTDKSGWSAVASFITPCTAVTSFTENFDALTTPAIPSCWRKVSTTGLLNTQTTNPNSSPNTLYIYGSSPTDMSVVSLTPVSNLSAGTHRLKFKARANFTVGGIIEVGYLTNPSDAASFTLIQSITASSLTYQDYEVIPAGVPAGDSIMAFRHTGSPANSVLIDDVKWEAIPTCDVPTALSVSNITTAGADISWSAPAVGSPIDYQIYYNTTGVAPNAATVPLINNASSPTTISSGLGANTPSYVWVRSNCGPGDVSLWAAVPVFTTLCNATNVPYTQNFESATVPALPSCTSLENAGTGNNWVTISNPGSGFATKTLRYAYNSTNAANVWFFTQGLNLTSGTSYRISYRYGNNSTTYVEKLEVKYGTAANSTSMTDVISNHPSVTGGAPASVYYDFTPSATGVYYIGFHAYSALDQDNLYVDDISVIVTPTCEVPTTISASNITTSGADISWSDPTTGNPPVNYQLYYSDNSTAPTGATTPTVSGVVGTTTTIGGLNASTLYYLWIRTNCGSGSVSDWTPVPYTFATLCTSASIPTASQSFDAASMPVCWTTATVTGTINWAPDTDNDGVPSAHSGARFMGKDYTASDALTFSQPINMTTAGSAGARINVWIYRNTVNKANDRIRFHINQTQSLSGATQLLEIFPLTTVAPTVASAGWYNYTANIPASYNTETTVYIIAQGTTDGTFASYGIGFDDFYVEPIPSCNEPTGVVISNVTTSGAKVDWSVPAAGTPVNYQIYYSDNSAAPTGATTPTVTGLTGTTANLTLLNSATTYYLWMRTFCGGSNYSPWTAGAKVFTTACTPATLPYSENFETATVPNMPSCTSKENAGTGDEWEVVSNPGNGFTSKNLQYNYNSSSDANAWFYTRPVSLTGGTTYTLTFRYGNNSVTYIESLKVMYGTAAANASMTNAIVDYPAITGGTPSTSSTNFTPSVTGVYYIGFNAYSIADQWNLYVDDIALSATTLPVSLTDFKGETIGSFNRLSWTTATETNNKGFELQRSADGKEFSALTFVATKANNGNSTSALNYSFNDEKPIGGTNYYRLKQLDKDGKFTYSNIVILKSKITDIRFTSVYPNPATKELKMIISSPSAEKVTLIVTDITGKVLMQQNTQLVMGDNQSRLNVQSLAAGTYFIKAVCANGCETAVHRFVKQ